MNSHMRMVHQVIAIVLSLAMIITLTLGALHKISYLVFWITAAICLAVAMIFYRTPSK